MKKQKEWTKKKEDVLMSKELKIKDKVFNNLLVLHDYAFETLKASR